MAASNYATVADYFMFKNGSADVPAGTDEDEILANLRRASTRVTRDVRLARLTYDADGFPTNAQIRQAFAYAAVAEVLTVRPNGGAWDNDDDDYESVTMAGVTLKAAPGSGASGSAVRGYALHREALDILVNTGIFSTKVIH